MENSMKVQLKMELPYSPATPLLGHVFGLKHNSKRYMTPNVLCSTTYNSQDMEVTRMFIDRGMNKEDVVHIYNGILLSH